MTQPIEELIIWANTDVNLPELAGPNKTKPIDDLINKGWDFTEKPTADEFNYILNNIGQWVNWTVTEIETGTSSNIPDTLVRRDGSGNFSAGTITANLSGNASTSVKWQTARTLTLSGDVSGSVNIDGSNNVTLETSTDSISSSISILTGTILNGGTIPLPSGYTSEQCVWFVSPNAAYLHDPNTPTNILLTCTANSSRVVTITSSEDDFIGTFATQSTANYIIIGHK